MIQCDSAIATRGGMATGRCGRPAKWIVGALRFCTGHTSERFRVVPIEPPKAPPIPAWVTGNATARAGKKGQKARRRARAQAAGLNSKGKALARDRPFLAIDGEGVGKPGHQRFVLLRAGGGDDGRELYRRGRTLHTQECLEFILGLPADRILIGFAFNYDATHILEGLTDEQRDKLFLSDAERARQFGERFRYVHWRRYAIDYVPRQYLAVARLRAVRVQGELRYYIAPGSTRTIYETHGNFQSPFVKALTAYEVGAEHHAFIADMKAKRGAFLRMSPDVRRYNQLECTLLEALMNRYRQACRASEAMPETKWNGPAKIARALMKSHATTRTEDLPALLPVPLLDLSKRAYYGGRAEVSAIGSVSGPVWDCDMRSAYAAAVAQLPCLVHGKWAETTDPAGLYLAPARFSHPKDAAWCGLPFRVPGTGRLCWPRHGGGVYWSIEIEGARAIGATVTLTGPAWQYERQCTCEPFGWLQRLYSARHAGIDGQPVKRALAAIYGQFVRRIGGPGLFQNYLWGGLVTATTRARLLYAIVAATDPRNVVMLATDGIVSREQLAGLDQGEQLGAWREGGPHAGIFIVQPGLYWSAGKSAAKGLTETAFTRHMPAFEAAWKRWLDGGGIDPGRPWWRGLPSVPIELETFISLRQAAVRGQHETAGRWETVTRNIDFKWHNKRDYTGAELIGGAAMTRPLPGASGAKSGVYEWDDETMSEAQALELLCEGLPDAVDWSPPGL